MISSMSLWPSDHPGPSGALNPVTTPNHFQMTDQERQAALLIALDAHDLDRIQSLVDHPKGRTLLQCNVLPWAETKDVAWFWSSIQTDPEGFPRLCRSIREACTGRLLIKGFEPGVHFSWADDHGIPALLLNPSAHAHLIKTLPPERYSTARIVIRDAE